MIGGLHIAILAAGQSTRFGSNKLDAHFAGRPLGGFALDSALALDPERLTIIVAEPVPEFARRAADDGVVDLLLNPRAQEGISTSVALAASKAAAAGADALLLLLADMPFVAADTLRQLATAVAPGRPAAVRHGDGKAGIPACFPRDHLPALQALQGDHGAAMLLRQSQNVTLIATGASELRDIDVPDDLDEAAALRST